MFVRNTLCDIVVARNKQWIRMVSWIKNTEIPALAVIRDDVSKKKKKRILLMLHCRDQ